MIIDANLLLDNSAALTATRDSTNVIDLGKSLDLGNSHLHLAWRFTTLPASSGASTITVSVQTSDDNSTWTTLVQSDAMPKAAFTAAQPWGTFRPEMPLGVKRYIKLNYAVGTANLTAGKVHATLTLDREFADKFYAKNYAA